MIHSYIRNKNNKIVIINGTRESFRLRQRSLMIDGSKVPSLRFISYKEAIKMSNKKELYGPFILNTKAKI